MQNALLFYIYGVYYIHKESKGATPKELKMEDKRKQLMEELEAREAEIYKQIREAFKEGNEMKYNMLQKDLDEINKKAQALVRYALD